MMVGYIPHFHYVDEGTRGKKFHSCIRIDVPEYFNHGNKQDKLNSKQVKELVEFMKQPFRNKKIPMTNWEFIVESWNDNNSKRNVEDDCEMPDYTKLK